MKLWALIVAGLYVALLAVLTAPAIALFLASNFGFGDAIRVYASRPYWVWLAIMVACQFAMLAVPIRVASHRPVKRGPVWLTLFVGGLMAAGLAIGGFAAIYEFATHLKDHGNWSSWAAIGLGALTWCVWAVVFGRMSRNTQPADLVSRQCRSLFKGSVLELLIAVPTHIAARSRDDCCAGILTFVGLTTGISAMLFSFGPAVFFLYAERWKRLHPPPPAKVPAGI